MWIQHRLPFYQMAPKIQGYIQEWYRRLPRLASTPEQHRRPILTAALRPISASHGRIRFGPFTKLNAANAASVAWAHEQSATCSRWLCVPCRHGCDVCRSPRDFQQGNMYADLSTTFAVTWVCWHTGTSMACRVGHCQWLQ